MSFFGSLFGTDSANAANAAASDTYAKQLAAAQGLKTAGNQYQQGISNIAQGYQPYVGAGQGALAQLAGGLGLAGQGGSENFVNAYHALPGYQAGLDTGTRAITQSQAANGLLKSGSTLKALQKFGQNYEDQKSGDYLQRLYGLAGMGQGATGAQIGTLAQGYGGQLAANQGAAQDYFNAAPTIGQGQIAGAQAQQTALGNLLGAGAYLGGSFLGGGFGTAAGKRIFGS